VLLTRIKVFLLFLLPRRAEGRDFDIAGRGNDEPELRED
jgi:hypothetical protein